MRIHNIEHQKTVPPEGMKEALQKGVLLYVRWHYRVLFVTEGKFDLWYRP